MKHIMEGGDNSGNDSVHVGFDHSGLQKGTSQFLDQNQMMLKHEKD